MVLISIQVLQLAVHLAIDMYSDNLDWFLRNDLRYPGNKDLPHNFSSDLPWLLYEHTIARDNYLFVVIQGSRRDSDWVPYGWGNSHAKEQNVTLGQSTVRVHSGYYAGAAHVWQLIKSTVSSYSGPVIFAGHSRGGAISQLLHVIASNELPAKKSFHFSVVLAPRPTILSFEEALEDHSYVFVLNHDPVPRLSVPRMIAYMNGAGGPVQAAAALRSLPFTDRTVLRSLQNFGREDAWTNLSAWYREDPTAFKISKLLGRIYWLQHEWVGQISHSWSSKPIKYLHEHQVAYEALGDLNWLGLPDHFAGFHRYDDYVDHLPCLRGSGPAVSNLTLVGKDEPSSDCVSTGRWSCLYGLPQYSTVGVDKGVCEFLDYQVCKQNRQWRTDGTVIRCFDDTRPRVSTPTFAPFKIGSRFGVRTVKNQKDEL